ncbi:MAG: hypothetical protein COA79_07445 [Planctomycetota bacterium]|nr:MAG: hypothetical protein COA79_07445 [Planctomycetota bacterium]
MKQNTTLPESVEQWRKDPFIGLSKIMTNSKERNTLIGQSVISMLNAENENYNESEGRKLAQQVVEKNERIEINLYALFLIVWSIMAAKGQNLDESKMILNKLDEINEKELLPEIIATILATKGYHYGVSGNKTLRITYLQNALKISNVNEAHKIKLITGAKGALQTQGRLKDLEKLITKKNKVKENSEINSEEDFANLSNAIQLCQISYAKKLFEKIKSNPNKLKLLQSPDNQFDVEEIYLNFMDQPAKNNFLQNTLDDQSLEYYDKWMTTTGYLYLGKQKEGLKWARRYTQEHPIGMGNRNLQSFTLIRAEISNKNCEAAKGLLLNKIKKGYPHFLDVFFYARIALLEDKNILALDLIKKLQNSCTHYEAFERLAFELELSCELSTKDTTLFLTPIEKKSKKKSNTLETIDDNDSNTEKGVIIGISNAIQLIKTKISKFSKDKGIILLNGETGVGKEVIARSIHENSPRKTKPYIPINCGSISESLLQSELFGHVAGAFTGAHKYQPGVFEAAKDGTVFLDEIGEITPQVQIALLRVLENKCIRPIGSTETKKINCKILAATNKDLESLTSNGQFREDLYYRLNQLNIHIPPLRERVDDIIPLSNYFLSQNRTDGQSPSMSNELQDLIKKYEWPGNVRQLKNEMEKMRLLNSEKMHYEAEDFTIKEITQNLNPQFKHTNIAPPNSQINELIQNGKTALRRKEKILDLFKTAGTLTRGEIIKALQIAPGTATSYLKSLEKEGYIKKIKPSASTRTHYFEFCK